MNQRIHTSRHGCERTPLPIFADLTERDVSLFTRALSGRFEAFPGIPVDEKTGAFMLYFYPATPLWIAFLHQLGGVPAALRAMSILGLLSAALLFYGTRRCGWSTGKAGCSAFLLLIQPIVLYHMHTPCSEMLELTVMTGILVVLSGLPSMLLFPLVAVACLNRPGFIMPPGILALLLSTGAWLRMERRASCWAVLWVAAGIGCSLLYYHTAGADSLIKIRRVFTAMEQGAVACMAMAFGLVWIRRWRSADSMAESRWFALVGMGVPLCGFMLAVVMNPRGGQESLAVAGHLAGYTGWPLLMVSGVGLIVCLAGILIRKAPSPPGVFVVVCVFVFALPLGYKHVADLYPWATKRFVSSLPLLVALGSGEALWLIVRKGRAGRVAAGALFVFVVGWNAENTAHAWSRVEYRGMHETLSTLIKHITADDVVLADHFLWATPLALSYDRCVLNGERLWADPSPERISGARAWLYELHRDGRRILLLTSTEQGPHVFPSAFHNARPIASPIEYPHQVIAHHRNSNGFWIRQEHSHLLLSEWTPQGGLP